MTRARENPVSTRRGTERSTRRGTQKEALDVAQKEWRALDTLNAFSERMAERMLCSEPRLSELSVVASQDSEEMLDFSTRVSGQAA